VSLVPAAAGLARAGAMRGPRIWYLLTPPPHLSNVGDHAQAVAIDAWIRRDLGAVPIELDKDEYRRLRPMVRKLVRPEDLILIHSGGNLGDRGIWSEQLRRQIILDHRANRVLSLPQTIWFSDSEVGRSEAMISSEVYRQGQQLEVLARDRVSLSIGAKLFPEACHEAVPDFVVGLDRREPGADRDGLLLCLRGDDESALSPEGQSTLLDLANLTHARSFDTTLPSDIRRSDRRGILDATLDLFQSQRIVVTDRFHGVIFSFLTRTPCVVIDSADHKLRSSIEWFAGCPHIAFEKSPEAAHEIAAEWMAAEPRECDCDDLAQQLRGRFGDLANRVRHWSSGRL